MTAVWINFHAAVLLFTPLEIMLRCSAAGLNFRIIPAGFNAPLEFLTGFTSSGNSQSASGF
jgi:hypothetical protein